MHIVHPSSFEARRLAGAKRRLVTFIPQNVGFCSDVRILKMMGHQFEESVCTLDWGKVYFSPHSMSNIC